MRFTYFLLVATATLLASCNAAAATSNNQNKLSTMTSTDAAVPVLKSSNDKRFLRSYREEDDGDDSDDEEERSVMTAEQVAKWSKKVERWVKKGHTPSYIKDKLTALDGTMNAKNKRSTACSELLGAGPILMNLAGCSRRLRRLNATGFSFFPYTYLVYDFSFC
ncbi:hypothetical protein DVH05_020156 [Phytophthora capsici]|nr:hypothetical protein DVH05_020156 [Phytophthora capsici]